MSASTQKADTSERLCYRIEEAAAMVGCPVKALRQQVWGGSLPVVTFPGGKRQYIRRQDLLDFIDQCAHVEGRGSEGRA